MAGMKDVYQCLICKDVMVTLHRDVGFAPSGIACRDKKCLGRMRSLANEVSQIIEPTHEWYKPDMLEGLDDETKAHVQRGGLLLREIQVGR